MSGKDLLLHSIELIYFSTDRISMVQSPELPLLCFSNADYGSVCGASVLVISTTVCVVCVIVCIKHKHKGTYLHSMK